MFPKNEAELAPVSPSVFILHLSKPLFSVFHVFQALSIFVLVNDLYIGDPLSKLNSGNMHIPVRLCS